MDAAVFASSCSSHARTASIVTTYGTGIDALVGAGVNTARRPMKASTSNTTTAATQARPRRKAVPVSDRRAGVS